jgi:hypothetical protein
MGAFLLAGCAAVSPAVPRCGSINGLTVEAQSVPTASYVPCLGALPAGWSAGGFQPSNSSTRFRLLSDRAGRPVLVRLAPSCDVTGATPTTPRATGVRTSIQLTAISPRYAGVLADVFAGGCITYAFDFPRGPHIGLMEDLMGAVILSSRHELALRVHHDLGVLLGP